MIETLGLTKIFRGHPGGRPAVAGLDLAVPIGVVFALLGPNGSGKTTTVRMLTTVLPPSRGLARILGRDTVRQASEVRRLVACVPQRSAMSYQLDLEANVTTYLVLAGYPLAEARRRTRATLERFGLAEHRSKKPHELSGGLLRRAQLARVLARDVPVLFLDEPTTGLDPAARRDLWNHIRSLRREGRLVFLTTHSLEEAEALADVVGILREGRLAAFGAPAELRTRYRTKSLEEVYFRAVGSGGPDRS